MNRRKYIYIGITFIVMTVFCCTHVKAQQEPHFTQYMFNRLSYNPGYAGSNGAICVTGFYRNQWMGLTLTDPNLNPTGASVGETMNISFDMPVKFLHGGIGAAVITDKIGFWDNTYIKLDYAYRFQLPTGNLAIGLEAQLFNASLDKSKLQGGDQRGDDDGERETSDPVLANLNDGASEMLFDLGLGVYYQVPGKVYIGAAVSKLLQTKSATVKWEDRRFFYVVAGYEYTLPDYPSWRILPSALLKTDFASSSSYQLDMSTLIEYSHKVWGGVSYRVDDAVMLLAGMTYRDLKFGVAYDIPTSRVSTKGTGSLELFLRWCFKFESSPDAPTIYRNTIKM